MKAKINYIAKSDSYLFPGCYYLLNDEDLLANDQEFFERYKHEIKEEEKYIFILDGMNPVQSKKNYLGVNHGVLAKIMYINHNYYINVLGKAILFIEHYILGTLLAPDSFVRYEDAIKLSVIRAQIRQKYGGIIHYEDDYLYKEYDNFKVKDSMVIKILNTLDHLINIRCTKLRSQLYRYYDYTFYLDVLKMLLDLIDGHLINTRDIMADSLDEFFSKVLMKVNATEKNDFNHQIMIENNQTITMEFFSEMDKYEINLPVREYEGKIPYGFDLDFDTNNVDFEFARHLLYPMIIEGKKSEIEAQLDPRPVLLAKYFPEKIKEEKEPEEKNFNKNQGQSLFDEIFGSDDGYITTIEEDQNDLWKKKILTKEEREQLYYDFLKQDYSTMLENFQKLNYIPEFIRQAVKSSEDSGTIAEKGKTRLLGLIRLPWHYETKDRDLKIAEVILNQGHYGLERVKEAILEYITLVKYTKDNDSKILCLYGPPGVGKTSIAKNIALALGRNFCSLSLGSISSELDLQGINQSYTAATYGGIIKSMIKAGSNNPVFLLDEIDKAPKQTTNGNITGILMNLLDANTNDEFVDSFLMLPYDLSQVLFICTANDLSDMPQSLLNRVEIINIPSYTPYEKVEIIKRFLIPKIVKRLKIDLDFHITDPALKLLTKQYALDGGMRESARYIEKIVSKSLMKYESNQNKTIQIGVKEIREYLGKAHVKSNNYKQDIPGLVNLLGATNRGGMISKMEVSQYPGTGQIYTTGNLGKILNESVNVAFGFMKSNMEKLGLDKSFFKDNNYHFHFLDNTTSKEGSSGGVGISVGIYSLLLKKVVPNNIAFTGEITLKGKILPIGGIINKISVCEYENIDVVYMPLDNKDEVISIQKELLDDVEIKYFNNIFDLLNDVFN